MEEINKQFEKIFELKGLISPIAEKANKNLKLKNNNNFFKKHLYHYTIGHTLKGVDKKIVFQYKQDLHSFNQIPQRFTSLHWNDFSFPNLEIINNIRNLYCHYIHDFKKLNIDEEENLKKFLEESFELALIFTYLKSENSTLEDVFKPQFNYDKIKYLDSKLVEFLQKMFYPYFKSKNNVLMDEERILKVEMDKRATDFKKLSLKEAISKILFIEVKNSFEWELEIDTKKHGLFTIEKGTYMTRYGHMLLLSMFLYRNESELLISQVKGFKRSNTLEFRNKRNLFSFFSKKFSSQDINSEEGNLIKFRDILQYLSKYPLAWNKSMESFYLRESKSDPIYEKAKILEETFFQNEFERLYPDYKEDNDFYNYFKSYILLSEKSRETKIKNFIIKKMDFLETEYFSLLYYHPKVHKYKREISESKDVIKYNKNSQAFNIYVIGEVVKNYFPKKENDYKDFTKHKFSDSDNSGNFSLEYVTNKNINKLIQRINQKTLWKSYGRNQDRFMEFSIRFLAENNYFGEEALFKSYVAFGAKEQAEALEEEIKALGNDKKNIGKLKFHKGKLVKFQTYKEIKDNFPLDYCPFVIENNAVQIKFEGYYVSIQRNLIPYLLEHFTFNKGKIQQGKDLFKAYITKQLNDFDELKKNYISVDMLSDNDKTKMLKLFPKSIVHQKTEVLRQKENLPTENPFKNILIKALNAEEKYEELKKQADDLNRLEDFLKKNKGKQFRLYFIKKVWNIMFFKEKYKLKKQTAEDHHTDYHISREEFKDFSRYLFGMEEIIEYKAKLLLLLNAKSFLDEEGYLKNIITKSKSIHEIYNETKILFENWIDENPFQKIDKKHNLESFISERKQIRKNEDGKQHILYINTSHFIDFLIEKQIINASTLGSKANRKISYSSLDKYKKHLIAAFYPDFSLNEQRKLGSVYKKINTSRLEDACLYAIADNYLRKNLFDSTFSDIKNKNNNISVKFESVHKEKEVCNDFTVKEIFNLDFQFKVEETNNEGVNTTLQPYFLVVPFNKIDLVSSWLYSNKNEKDGERSSVFLKDLSQYLLDRYKNFNYDEITRGKTVLSVRENNKNIWDEIYDFKDHNIVTWHGIAKIQTHLLPLALQFTQVYMQFEKYYIIKNLKNSKELSFKDNKIDIIDIEGLRDYFGYNSVTKKVDDLKRHEAFHLNFPKNKTYLKRLEELEKEFISKEINYNPDSWESIKDEEKSILITFLNTIHNSFYDQKERNRIKKVKSANEKYFDKILKPINNPRKKYIK